MGAEALHEYLQGSDGRCLKREVVVTHKFVEGHPPNVYRYRLLEPIRKLQSGPSALTVPMLKHYYEEGFIALFKKRLPPGWKADRAPARANVSYNLPAAVIADVRKAR